ncbi:MAG: hypothetical protein RL641_239 [Candidatus Parcubacteria bacterium]|jgi:hypothetical protein
MTWAGRRKLYYGGLACIVIALFLFVKIYPKLSAAPTCFDGKQNTNERGVDCGGGCAKICQADASPLVVKWSRSFKVGDGFYNAFAYVENQNIRAAAPLVRYEFTLYDKDNVFITTRQGSAYVPPNGRLGIFESAIDTGKRAPKYTTFHFLNEPIWLTVTEEESTQSVFAEAGVPTNLDIAPRLQVSLENQSISTLRNIDVFAIIYDEDGIALGTSKTSIDTMVSGQKKSIPFTWREPFAGASKRTEVITQVNVLANRQ